MLAASWNFFSLMLAVEDMDSFLYAFGVVTVILLLMIRLALLLSSAWVLRTADILEFNFFCWGVSLLYSL